jgi:hypothetical protein
LIKQQHFYLKYKEKKIHFFFLNNQLLFFFVLKVSDISKEELGDLVEKELQSTHETIDEAVRQLEV